MSAHTFLPLTRVTDVERSDRGLRARLLGGPRPEMLRVDAVRDDVVRLQISRGGRFEESPTFAVREDLPTLPLQVEVQVDPGRAQVVTAQLRVTVGLDPFRIDVHRRDGSVVLETASAPHPFPGTQPGSTTAPAYLTYATLNDAFTFSRRTTPASPVYGLGEKTGPVNRRGRDYSMWNVDVLNPTSAGEFTSGREASDPRADNMGTEFDPYYMSIPFAIHQDTTTGDMSGSFMDNGYRAHYDFRSAGRTTVRFEGGQYTEYVIAGPRLPDILEAYTWLTGRAPLPPMWALGHHQCRWHAYSQQEVEDLATRLREHDIPCDSLWLDIDYMDGYRVFTWNRDLFPDSPAMLRKLAGQGFRMVTIVDPGVKAEPGYPVFDDALERDVLCRTEGGDVYIGQVWPGDTAFPDFATQEARAWWGELNAQHVGSGIAGIWNDMNEPATGDIDPMRMRFGRGAFSHERYHNQYALLMAMGTTQGLLAAMPDRRTFVLSRAGSAGIQRYAANWMGDNVANWDHLRMGIAMGCGLGLSGQPFVGADIGGFAGDSDPELFARWMQYGALTPFCRNHSMVNQRDQYPWSFGSAVEEIARAALKLRYRLLPYLYSSFVQAAESGAPVQRALAFDFQYDPVVADIDDEYLFGPDLLVAPVTRPGLTRRQVYLPGGAWYDWHSGEHLDGTRHIVAEAPLELIPLYARAGSVIPMLEQAPASTDTPAPVSVQLHVFLPDEGDAPRTSLLQEDDGVTFAAARGERVRTEFRLSRQGDVVRLEAVCSGEGFQGFARTRFEIVVHGGQPRHALLDGAAAEVDGSRVLVPVGAQGFVLEFEV